jgi:hypothetical protein
MMRAYRVYADTSIFGGVFDMEFTVASQTFFNQVGDRFVLVTSALVQAELTTAPDKVRDLFDRMLADADIAAVSEAAISLQQAYLRAGVVTAKWATDALHVALATVAECDFIVSWNFKHIVHFEKIPLYNAVNTLEGYGAIAIYSPREVISYGENED